ncbi:MAG: c-type cytochrome [Proteobacteria bacterium]|nr:c-type cytochrome [Pseudomonadota bacterium]
MKTRKLKCLILLFASIYSSNVISEENRIAEDKFASVRDKLQICFTCHGENGASTQPTYPILAGQEFYYLYVQLKDFKSGLREDAIMSPLVANIEKQDLRLMAEYFGEQEWQGAEFTASPEQISAGKKVVDAGQCVACHLGAFNGNSRIPRLAGQHFEYLNKTMLDFKNKQRNNAQPMNALFGTFSDDEIKAVSQYLSGFKE